MFIPANIIAPTQRQHHSPWAATPRSPLSACTRTHTHTCRMQNCLGCATRPSRRSISQPEPTPTHSARSLGEGNGPDEGTRRVSGACAPVRARVCACVGVQARKNAFTSRAQVIPRMPYHTRTCYAAMTSATNNALVRQSCNTSRVPRRGTDPTSLADTTASKDAPATRAERERLGAPAPNSGAPCPTSTASQMHLSRIYFTSFLLDLTSARAGNAQPCSDFRDHGLLALVPGRRRRAAMT